MGYLCSLLMVVSGFYGFDLSRLIFAPARKRGVRGDCRGGEGDNLDSRASRGGGNEPPLAPRRGVLAARWSPAAPAPALDTAGAEQTTNFSMTSLLHPVIRIL